jgi:acyl-CoA thioesterase I
LARLVERLVRESSVYCPPSGGFADLGAALPRLSERLRKGQQIKIVAIGSSSTAGAGASNARNSYPARLASELRRLWPHIQLSVVNKGVNGDEAPQMMARFDADVRAENPDLVIWQVGTNAVITSNGVYRYEPTIQDGIHRLKAMGVDVIVMDPQYAPQVYTDPDYREMVRIIDRTARLEQVALFRRFHTTRYWVREQGIALADLVTADGLHHTDRGYACIAEALAQGIDAAARGAPLEQR